MGNFITYMGNLITRTSSECEYLVINADYSTLAGVLLLWVWMFFTDYDHFSNVPSSRFKWFRVFIVHFLLCAYVIFHLFYLSKNTNLKVSNSNSNSTNSDSSKEKVSEEATDSKVCYDFYNYDFILVAIIFYFMISSLSFYWKNNTPYAQNRIKEMTKMTELLDDMNVPDAPDIPTVITRAE